MRWLVLLSVQSGMRRAHGLGCGPHDAQETQKREKRKAKRRRKQPERPAVSCGGRKRASDSEAEACVRLPQRYQLCRCHCPCRRRDGTDASQHGHRCGCTKRRERKRIEKRFDLVWLKAIPEGNPTKASGFRRVAECVCSLRDRAAKIDLTIDSSTLECWRCLPGEDPFLFHVECV